MNDRYTAIDALLKRQPSIPECIDFCKKLNAIASGFDCQIRHEKSGQHPLLSALEISLIEKCVRRPSTISRNV